MRLDKMTPEQRARFEAHCADERARWDPLLITCMVCNKPVWDPHAPVGQQRVSADMVVVPYFAYFCGQACANLFESDYGILFKRDATGRVSYD